MDDDMTRDNGEFPCHPEHRQFAPAVPMQIEEGKFYRNRAGKKIGPMEGPSHSDWWHGPALWFDGESFSLDGLALGVGYESEHDLIAVWRDEPEPHTEGDFLSPDQEAMREAHDAYDFFARAVVEHGPEDHHDHPAQDVPIVTPKSDHGTHLPTDAAARKALPLCTGVLDYFPDALAAVAEVSRIGNDQHNPGQPLHWAKEKSTDHADCAVRHLAERGTRDTDGGRHTAKAAWRVLAHLQMEIEAENAGMSLADYIATLKKEAA